MAVAPMFHVEMLQEPTVLLTEHAHTPALLTPLRLAAHGFALGLRRVPEHTPANPRLDPETGCNLLYMCYLKTPTACLALSPPYSPGGRQRLTSMALA
jgi:hypothetical protein